MKLASGASTRHLLPVTAVGLLLTASLAPNATAAAGPAHQPPAAAPSQSRVVDTRASHHPGFDRFVVQFDSARAPRAEVRRVSTLVQDASGLPVPVPGRAILRVVLRDTVAHDVEGASNLDLDRAFALPNIMASRAAGDFEGVVTLGLGLAAATPFHVHRLTGPGRLAIDVSTSFARTNRTVLLARRTNDGGLVRTSVMRPVPDAYPAAGLLDRILAGPTREEEMRGIVRITSGATGFSNLSIRSQVARVRLTGGCRGAGMRFTIADHVLPTLRRLRTVSWVKVYDGSGATLHPTGRRDSVPRCLLRTTGSCVYLVKDVQPAPDITVGSFIVAHVLSGSLLGSAGEFYSEWYAVRGRIEGTRALLQRQDEGGHWQDWPQTWVPADRTLAGWTPITGNQLRRYSGGGVPLPTQPCG